MKQWLLGFASGWLGWLIVLSVLVPGIRDNLIERGKELGRQEERAKPGSCTTQQHMEWWFNGDSTKQRTALKRACKGVQA